MATPEPCAATAKLAINVAGGQTIRSALPASAPAPAMILASSPIEPERPFIFQLPATSGIILAAIKKIPFRVRLSDRHRGGRGLPQFPFAYDFVELFASRFPA